MSFCFVIVFNIFLVLEISLFRESDFKTDWKFFLYW